MKFATQHKSFLMSKGGGNEEKFTVHRDFRTVWITIAGAKGTSSVTLWSVVFSTVRKAKAFMNNPSPLRPSEAAL